MNKTVIKKYLYIMLFLTVVSTMLIFCLSFVSEIVMNRVSTGQNDSFEKGESAFGAQYDSGLPLREHLIYNGLSKFSDDGNVIILGSSTTREGILPEKLAQIGETPVHNMGMQGISLKDLKALWNFVSSRVSVSQKDIIKIDIGLTLFKDRPLTDSVFVDAMTRMDVYRVDEDSNVSKGILPVLFARPFYKNQTLIRYLEETIKDSGKKVKVPDAADPKVASRYQMLTNQNLADFSISDKQTEFFFDLLLEVKKYTDILIVEDIYRGSWVDETTYGADYTNWIETKLKPFCEQNNIIFIDASKWADDSLYSDHAHLSYKGRVMYTQMEKYELEKALEGGSNGSR